MNTERTEHSSIIISHEKRAQCAALANAIEAAFKAMPKAQKKHWWQRDAYVGAIAHLRQMAEFGNGGGVLPYTANTVIIELAARYGVRVCEPPRKATSHEVASLGAWLDRREERRPHVRA